MRQGHNEAQVDKDKPELGSMSPVSVDEGVKAEEDVKASENTTEAEIVEPPADEVPTSVDQSATRDRECVCGSSLLLFRVHPKP